MTRRDICCALKSATTAQEQDATEAKWRLTGGCDDDGESLGVVIIFSGRQLIVTVF
ncbi:MAG TPA: hypothetical protein VJN18_15015 [Polyangiaceae bacterium]|nr:hypothetical protein [Polyangiaceae bacterium]